MTSAATQASSSSLPPPSVPPLNLNFQKPDRKGNSALPTASSPRLELEIIRQQQVCPSIRTSHFSRAPKFVRRSRSLCCRSGVLPVQTSRDRSINACVFSISCSFFQTWCPFDLLMHRYSPLNSLSLQFGMQRIEAEKQFLSV